MRTAVVTGILACLMLGRGFGLLPLRKGERDGDSASAAREGAGAGADAGERSPPPVGDPPGTPLAGAEKPTRDGARPEEGAAPSGARTADREGRGQPGEGAGGPPHGSAAPPAAPGAVAPLGIDDPRRARFESIRAAIGAEQLGTAGAALEQLHAEVGPQPELVGLHELLLERVAGKCEALAAHLRAGKLLGAERRLLELLEPEAASVRAALDRLCEEQGWPTFTAEWAGEREAVPEAQPLARNRFVRVVHAGETVRSRVVAVEGDQVTLRVVGQEGVTFPTVPVWTVEPEAVTGEEAAGLGLAALAAGELHHARLWCACGLARSDAPGERLARLCELLR